MHVNATAASISCTEHLTAWEMHSSVELKQTNCIVLQAVEVQQPEVLAFRGRRTGTSQVRRKLATSAVMQNYKPPPTAPVADTSSNGTPVQRTIQELFQRQAAAVTAADTAVSMEVA